MLVFLSQDKYLDIIILQFNIKVKEITKSYLLYQLRPGDLQVI